MPPGFGFPDKVELWMRIAAFGDPGMSARTGHNRDPMCLFEGGKVRQGAGQPQRWNSAVACASGAMFLIVNRILSRIA
jgi:hypothetical protein